MESIKISNLELSGVGFLGKIIDFYAEIQANEHAMARVLVEVSEKDISLELFDKILNAEIMILCNKKVVFAGICKEFTVDKKDTLQIYLITATSILDLKKEKCSFQDCSKSFRQIIEDILLKEKCGLEYEVNTVRRKVPYIQYNETDWEFIRRLVAQMNSVIYPEYRKVNPMIKIGLKEEGKETQIDILQLSHCFSDKYWEQEENNYRTRRDFVYYKVISYDDLEIGNFVNINNELYLILEKKIFVDAGEVIFEYKAGNLLLVKLAKYNNKQFAGLTIQGEVLSTTKETVRVKFLFDKEQKKEKAYNYMWAPETGNVMYLMPQVTTTVNIYFKNECEDSAIAVSCVRVNGQTQEKMSNSEDKFLMNESGKQIMMKADCIGFAKEGTNEKVMLNDFSDILVTTRKNITIASSKRINIRSKNLYIETPNELILKKIIL